MALPSTALGAGIVANNALAKIKAGIAAAVSSINSELSTLGEAHTITAPVDAQMQVGRRVAGWPKSLPAVRVFVATTTFLQPAGGLGLVDVQHSLVCRVFYEDDTAITLETDELDAQIVDASAYSLADALRQILERDLGGEDGIWSVQAQGIAPFDPARRADNTAHLIKVLDLSIAVIQRCRQNYI